MAKATRRTLIQAWGSPQIYLDSLVAALIDMVSELDGMEADERSQVKRGTAVQGGYHNGQANAYATAAENISLLLEGRPVPLLGKKTAEDY